MTFQTVIHHAALTLVPLLIIFALYTKYVFFHEWWFFKRMRLCEPEQSAAVDPAAWSMFSNDGYKVRMDFFKGEGYLRLRDPELVEKGKRLKRHLEIMRGLEYGFGVYFTGTLFLYVTLVLE